MQSLVNEIVNSLNHFVEKSKISYINHVISTSMTIMGVGAKNMRVVLKELRFTTKEWNYKEKIALALQLIDLKLLECQQMAYEFLAKDKTVLPNLTEEDLDNLNQNLDNWATVDTYSVYLSGPAWRMGIFSDKKIQSFLNSEDVMQRRVAIVSTIALNLVSQGGTGDVERTLNICKQVVDDHRDMIVKALSWALRELAKHEKEVVQDFIYKYEDILHKKVIREVNNKLYYGKKNINQG